MFSKSIRWRLQIWYGLILLLVLAGFGTTAYQLESGRIFRRIDGELQRRTGVLANSLRPLRDRFGGQRPLNRPRPEDLLQRDLPEPSPADGPPEQNVRRLEFRLPPQQAALFDESDTNGFYYQIFGRDHAEIARSENLPPRTTSDQEPRPMLNRSEAPPVRTRGDYREIEMVTPPGERILVGRSIAPELHELHRTAWKLSLVGTVILLLGLAGGWWLATRAIRPIEEISATAVRIAGGDLSQRINTAETESELGRLAGVLNSTFTRLETAFAQQQQFTSDAAHELRTPISVMLTQTQTSLNRERSAAEYRDTVEACQRSAQRMRRLIESLLHLARMDSGQETMQRHRFDIVDPVRSAVELIRPLAERRKLTIQTELGSVECVGDCERLHQVFTNLLTNAVQYINDEGEIRVTTRRDGDFAIAEIADNGPGIAPEHLPHVFDRFYRVDSARTTVHGRSGLGLAISKAIVDAHSGTIDVTSEEGRGTQFTVRLPVAV